ncbi:hypothetical protein AWJ20_4049 [Sugiyamaella lignohabitans]|uniref:2-dehydropantoate 2-reductase n=1 Tax=Sugiyamaella lignohabitans TaxID=796027 RepID=A0A167C5M4_9ASCO|nr:uncharacterized protein AWJ20_4049 [Sugiyamaella lignohabitans]ANB11246.1 hypothetical protein AWJ20_4049 [Sugiyamaella lignohabitans]
MVDTTKVQVLLVGSGGVGTIASLALEQSHQVEVTSVIRSDYDIVVEKGFTIESIDYGNLTGWRPTRVVKTVQEAVNVANGRPYDYIVVCTKVLPEIFKTEDLIRPAVQDAKTIIVLIQNGIDIEKSVSEAFPANVVLSGVSMIGSTNYGGKIVQFEHDKLGVGYYSSETTDSKHSKDQLEAEAKKFVDLYSVACKNCTYYPDLKRARWRKLVYNSTINTICALTQVDTGRAYLSQLDHALIYPAMAEIITIAETALGEPLDKGIDKIMLESDDGFYYKPSMQVDVDKGNPIEVEAILGNPLRTAKELNIKTPVLTVVYNLLRALQFRLMESRGYITVPENPSRKVSAPLLEPTTLPIEP